MGGVTLGRSVAVRNHNLLKDKGMIRSQSDGSIATAFSRSIHLTSNCDVLSRGAEAGPRPQPCHRKTFTK